MVIQYLNDKGIYSTVPGCRRNIRPGLDRCIISVYIHYTVKVCEVMMYTKTDQKSRMQVLINEEQREYLTTVSSAEGISISALLREIITQYQLRQKDLRLEQAVKDLVSEYKTNEELTALTSLDGEDFL